MSILLILSAVAYPKYVDLKLDTEGTSMSAVVRNVREKIRLHSSLADVPMSSEGYPDEVTPDWFPGRQMPRDLWTYGQLNIQTVNGPKDAVAPNNKTFTVKPDGTAAGHTAWYNRANGSFCVKVPDLGPQDKIEELFWLVNDSGYGSLSGNSDVEGDGNGGGDGGGNGNGNGNGGGDNDDDDDDDDD